MSLLPASTNEGYRGFWLSPWFLALAALGTLAPGLVHSFAPDGGMTSIAGLRPDAASARVVLGVFRWEGATQLALGLAMLAVALRYRTLTALFLALLALQTGLSALEAWVFAPPSGGHHPPENYGALVIAPLAAVSCLLALRPRRGPGPLALR